jgi:pyruvate kinase
MMVARGDLAVEVGDAVVPALQKRMIRMAREKNRAVITATQMMESMISNPIPTRAEVSDVANAVLDGTDAVMLSAETATGEFPVETVAAMARVCVEAEKEPVLTFDRRREASPGEVEEAIAKATMFTASNLNVKAIAAMTQSGKTVLLMSRMPSTVPIYAMSSVTHTRRRVTLFPRGLPDEVQRRARSRESAKHGRRSAARLWCGAGRRLHSAHDRRAVRQGRRNEHDEDRKGGRASARVSVYRVRRTIAAMGPPR